MAAAPASSGGGAGPGARIDVPTAECKFGSEMTGASNTYAVMKSAGGTGPGAGMDVGHGDLGGHGAPPAAATSTLASALNTYIVMKHGPKMVDN